MESEEQLKTVLTEDAAAENRNLNPSLVQITASNEEIERRINAFMERKRNEVNQQNMREYCGVMDPETDCDGCARTKAIFMPHSTGRSNYKVSRVSNQHGPQTLQKPPPSSSGDLGDSAIEMRLSTIEAHLGLQNAAVRATIHSRLRQVEDRILQLEGASPEYFNTRNFPAATNRRSRNSDEMPTDMTVDQIDHKMEQLRDILKKKQSDFM